MVSCEVPMNVEVQAGLMNERARLTSGSYG